MTTHMTLGSRLSRETFGNTRNPAVNRVKQSGAPQIGRRTRATTPARPRPQPGRSPSGAHETQKRRATRSAGQKYHGRSCVAHWSAPHHQRGGGQNSSSARKWIRRPNPGQTPQKHCSRGTATPAQDVRSHNLTKTRTNDTLVTHLSPSRTVQLVTDQPREGMENPRRPPEDCSRVFPVKGTAGALSKSEAGLLEHGTRDAPLGVEFSGNPGDNFAESTPLSASLQNKRAEGGSKSRDLGSCVLEGARASSLKTNRF